MAISYTLGGLKAVIADDLARPDLALQIENAIETSINFWKGKRFFFNETRTATFDTVADQSFYSSVDDADIPLFLELDDVFLTDSDGNRVELTLDDPARLHWLLGTGAGSGQPYSYGYYNSGFILYPIPDAVYTITPMGHIEIAAPASDSETGNAWMVNAFELIRAHAKSYLYSHTIRDPEGKAEAIDAAQSAKMKLYGDTNRRVVTGSIQRTSF